MFAIQFGGTCLVVAACMVPVWLCSVFINSFLELTDPDKLSTRFVTALMLMVGIGLIGLSIGGAILLAQVILR